MKLLMRPVCLVLALVAALGLAACKPESEKAVEALEPTLRSYLADDSGIDGADESPQADYGDDETASVLSTYGVDMEEFHRHCFARFAYEIKDASVSGDGRTAEVNVSITNVSLAEAAKRAASDYNAFAQTADAEAAYAENGHATLLAKLLGFLYAHLDSDALVTTDIVLTLSKSDDGSWSFDTNSNAGFFSALYGGSNVSEGLADAL